MSSNTNSTNGKPAGRSERRNRQRAKDFHHRYLALCRAKNFHPLPEIVKTKKKNQSFLDVYGDRFKCYDWQLITDALREDNSLNNVALRLRKTYTEGNDVWRDVICCSFFIKNGISFRFGTQVRMD